jgi:hypothetical protein
MFPSSAGGDTNPVAARNCRIRPGTVPALLAACAALLAGCAPSGAKKPAEALPGAGAIAGWTPAGGIRTYSRQTLFDYIDGASEFYFTYTFEELATNRYANEAGMALNVEVWRLTEPEDAYGLFSGHGDGEPASVGNANDAVLDPGSRLIFWQERFYVNLSAWDSVSDEDLTLFGEFISKSLPSGGERPKLVDRLPSGGLTAASVKYFHMELAIQDQLWLGGENSLGLGTDTDAVFARYRQGNLEWQLLLVQYPNAARADAGLQALLSGKVEGFAAADRNEALLGAVFGWNGGTAAQTALAAALGK